MTTSNDAAECSGALHCSTPTYQHYAMMSEIREALRPRVRSGEMLIYRDAFRWKNDYGDCVLPNHYEMFDLAGLASEFGYAVIHDFCHVAIVRPVSP